MSRAMVTAVQWSVSSRQRDRDRYTQTGTETGTHRLGQRQVHTDGDRYVSLTVKLSSWPSTDALTQQTLKY